MASLQLKVLGGFTVCTSSGQAVVVSGKKNQALLAYLAMNAGKRLSREKLINLLWSDRGDSHARSSLRQALFALRRDLVGIDPTPLVFDGDIVTVNLSAISTDLAKFERLATSGSVADLSFAAELYGGELLDGVVVRDPAFEEWLATERGRLREVLIGVLGRLLAHLTGTEAIILANRLIALDQLRESSHRTLMQVYAAHGQFEPAIRQYPFAETFCGATCKSNLPSIPKISIANSSKEGVRGRAPTRHGQGSRRVSSRLPQASWNCHRNRIPRQQASQRRHRPADRRLLFSPSPI